MDSPVSIYVKLKSDEKTDLISISRDQGEIRFQDSKSHTYTFSRIFPGLISMQEIFDTTTKPLVNLLKAGLNSLVLSYGHKATGKKTCLFGGQESGLYQLIIENLMEYAEEMESTKEISISVSVVEIFDENLRDLAIGSQSPQGFSSFERPIEVKEQLGKAFISDATCIDVKNAIEAGDLLRDSLAYRTNYEIKSSEYADRAHTFVLIYLKQRSKGSVWNQVTSSTLVLGSLASCERSKIKNGKEHYEHPLVNKAFVSLSKVLSNIKSPKAPWRDHLLTKVLKIGISDSPKIIIIATISPHKSCIQDSVHTLNFLEKCRPNQNSNLIEKLTDEEIEQQIQKLQEEKMELKVKLKKIESSQDSQLKKLCEIMGISDDIEGILSESNSQEIEKINLRVESVSKVEKQAKRSEILSKKVEENKVMLDRVKKLEFFNQEQHLKRVIDLREHLQRLKDELLTIQFNSKYFEQERVDAKSEELAKMVENSKCLIQEKQIIVSKLPQTLNPSAKPINPEELKSQGKQEIIEIYRRRFAEQARLHSSELKLANSKKAQVLSERQSVLNNMVENFNKTRKEKKDKIKSISKELISLYDLLKTQRKLIVAIQSGRFNQNLKHVNIPAERIPELPTKENFEELFKLIKGEEKPSNHPIMRLKESEMKKDVIPEALVETSELEDEELEKLIEKLKQAKQKTEDELRLFEEKEARAKEKIAEHEEILMGLKTDRDLYRDLFAKEQRNRNENRFLIESQRKIIESIAGIPVKSPKRPSSHSVSRPKK